MGADGKGQTVKRSDKVCIGALTLALAAIACERPRGLTEEAGDQKPQLRGLADDQEGGTGMRASASPGATGPASNDKRFALSGPQDRPTETSHQMGNMWGDQVGEGFGSGGLGLSPKGYGGGGRQEALNDVRLFGMIGALNTSEPANTEEYAATGESGFLQVVEAPLSTFSADVDTASYANVRRMLRHGRRPPTGSVRVEEFLNYFDYKYPEPPKDERFAIYTKVTAAPWQPKHQILHVGVSTRHLAPRAVPPRNLVFLLDVSGSMAEPDKLPLVRSAMELLLRQLRPEDHVGIVVYAGASGVVLPMTSGAERGEMIAALSRLEAGGGTNGGEGIAAAYKMARAHFSKGAINRVILATDGDFNIGATSQSELVSLIEKERNAGVFLTVLGVGTGNVKDATMEMLADKGNGNYAYLDSLDEARKVLEKQSGATLVTVAKDVKFQVEFNPRTVSGYRLIGYDNRRLAARDFNDDKKDAGEVGAGHSVTALYELIPIGQPVPGPRVDPLKYQRPKGLELPDKDDLVTLKIRYKDPLENHSQLVVRRVPAKVTEVTASDPRNQLALSVAEFALLLQGSDLVPGASYGHAADLLARARQGLDGAEPQELFELITLAQKL